MKQKTKLLLFLTVGISAISCDNNTTVDYRADSVWQYINETSHRITYDNEYTNELYALEPFDTVVVNLHGDCSSLPVEAENYCPPIKCLVVYYGDRYDSLAVGQYRNPETFDGVLSILNYEAERIDDCTFKFTYRFTDEMYDNARYVVDED